MLKLKLDLDGESVNQGISHGGNDLLNSAEFPKKYNTDTRCDIH